MKCFGADKYEGWIEIIERLNAMGVIFNGHPVVDFTRNGDALFPEALSQLRVTTHQVGLRVFL